MTTRAHRICLVSCTVLLFACSSSSDSPDGSGGGGGGGTLDLNGFGQRYKLADNELPGWTQDPAAGSFTLWDNTTLTQKIDGPATEYVKRGMLFAYYQGVKASDGVRSCIVVAMDFRSAANAKSMVDFDRAQTSASLTVPSYDVSVAVGYQTLTGMTVYANMQALYLEVQLDGYGYPPDLTKAAQDGDAFLKVMQAKPALQ